MTDEQSKRWAEEYRAEQERLEREAAEATERAEQHRLAEEAESARRQAARLEQGW